MAANDRMNRNSDDEYGSRAAPGHGEFRVAAPGAHAGVALQRADITATTIEG